jgi:hypothetical protein
MGDRELIEKAILEIEQVTKLFYEQKQTEGYQQLEMTLVSIAVAIDVIYKLKNEAVLHSDIKIEEIVPALSEAMKALEQRDSILLADILQYDIKNQLEIFYKQEYDTE